MKTKTLLEIIDLTGEKDILGKPDTINDDHILCCSAGHLYNPKNMYHVWWRGDRRAGSNCPETMSYDRMTGTRKCQRKLFKLNERVEQLYDKMFDKYYSGNELEDWEEVTFFGGGTADKYQAKIKELLIEGKKVKTGYRTSTMIRGSKTFYIFHK